MKSLLNISLLSTLLITLVSVLLTNPIHANVDDGIVDIHISMVNGDPGDTNVCVEITVDDLEDISLFQLPFQWDSSAIHNVSITNEYLNGAIGTINQDRGTLRYLFQDGTLENPVTIEDGVKLMDICFDIIGDGGTKTSIVIEDILDIAPIYLGLFLDSEENEVPYKGHEGCINIDGSPLDVAFCLEQKNVVKGTQACFSMKVAQFTKIQSFQYSIDYDTTILSYVEVINIPGELSSGGTFINLNTNGNLRVGWYDLSGLGITLDDQTTIFEVCFDVLTDADANTFIMLSDNIANGIEVTNVDNEVLGYQINCFFLVDSKQYNLTTPQVSISPNPAMNTVNILTEDIARIYSISCYDVHGNTIVSEQSYSSDDISWDISEWAEGVYFIKISTDQGDTIKKLVKI